jgi:ABC-2 type transport system ATP-binding protein
MSSDIAIKVEAVSKAFKLPHEKQSSVKGLVINAFRGKRTYELQQVLEEISFEIKKGEFFGIVGRNGSGKSTLLKLLAGIYTPDKGHIQVNGKLTPFIELGVGFNPELTGRENVFLNGALLGLDRKEMNGLYDEIVEFADLEKFMDQKLKNYSSGMQVRLAFSIAIRAKSDVLVLDEVLAVGDANFQKKCFDYFRKLKDENATVILVSHSMDSINKFSDRALMLEKGKIVIIGEPEEVSDKYIQSNIEKVEKSETTKNIKNNKIIKTIKLLDNKNKVIDNFKSNNEMNISIEYDTSTIEGDINFGVGLHLDTGGYVFGYNTQMDNYIIKNKKGTISLSFEELPILNGEYYLNIVCFGGDEAVPHEFIHKAFAFSTYSLGRASKYRGMIDITHNWSADAKR